MSGLHQDPNWPRATQWLAGEHQTDADQTLAVIGLPLNTSITPGRCDLAPAAIRAALARYSLYDSDLDIDVSWLIAQDKGDLDIGNLTPEAAFEPMLQALMPAMAGDCAVLLGGDNGITRVGVHAMGYNLLSCGVITFDAHHDLRDTTGGHNNGNPIRALLEEGMPGANIVQIGIQPFSNSTAYAAIAKEVGIKVVTADQVYEDGIEDTVQEALDSLSEKVSAIYIDLDLDVLDRAFAPACPGSRPGGLQPWMLRKAARLCGKSPKVKAMDLVEIDPTKDVSDITCLAAASFLLAFASGILARDE